MDESDVPPPTVNKEPTMSSANLATSRATAEIQSDHRGSQALPPSLYVRLGGARGIEAIVDDIMTLHLSNPLIKTRFASISSEKMPALKRTICDFFGAGSGGPEVYAGKDLATAHKGMNINEQELVAAVDDIVAALDKNGVGQSEKNEVVAILYSLKNQVIRL
jgi:hemoglobin